MKVQWNKYVILKSKCNERRTSMNIMIVEDDAVIASGLEYTLQQEGFTVKVVNTVEQALAERKERNYDLYLLDLGLPDGSGYDICKVVKKEEDTPVIFLTAVEDEGNVVMGLDMGADDYITKPFRIRELVSRIKSVLRRCQKKTVDNSFLELGDLKVNLGEGKVYKGQQEVSFTAMEYRLFLTFLNNRGQILTRTQLLEQIWDVSGDFINDNTPTVYIKRLREKIEDSVAQPRYIQTVRGMGYIMPKEG